MSAEAPTVILLVMTAQAHEAERLIASLRDGGLPVRGMYTANPDRIEELVGRRACDLVLCCAYDEAVDREAVFARHRELDADVPLIVIADPADRTAAVVEAMAGGARDCIARDDTERLQLVVARELSDLQARRQVKRLSQRLRQCEQRARELVETTEEAVAYIQDGMHLHGNPAFLSLLRFASLEDLQASAFLDLIEPDQRSAVRDFLRDRQSGQPQGSPELPVTLVRADASRVPGTLTAALAEYDGEACLRLLIRTTERLSLTAPRESAPGGAPDLTDLVAAIETLVGPERHPVQPFAVFYVHVRSAAQLLQNLGLTRGLGVIGTLGAILSRLCADTGQLVRICDDGFALLAPGLDESSAEGLAERIRAQVRLVPAPSDSAPIQADCELGYVVVSGACPSPSAILDEAYRACLSTDSAPGRSGPQRPTSLATREKQGIEEGDADIATELEWALANDRFLLVYQPIISLMGDTQENYTVLVRMIDAAENLIEAKEFIGPAIRSGLIERIDKWAIRAAVKAVSEHRQAGQAMNFFINLAEDSFRDPGVVIWLCDCLREFDVRGSWLTFVIQEELVERNLASLSRFVDSLKKIKCRVAINRFGASDHPQMLFQGMPLDFVLFLPQIVIGLADDKDKQQRLLALANLAREYNVKSVVTGVEDARSLTILWSAGVDYVQGNFLQRPSPTLEIAT